MFYYEKWDVYNAAVRLREIAQELSDLHPRGAAADLDQLRRASSSVLLNLCEGALERHLAKRIERYSISRSSASECNGCLKILANVVAASHQHLIEEGRDLANRIVAMMTNLIRNTERRQQEEEKRKKRGESNQDERPEFLEGPEKDMSAE